MLVVNMWEKGTSLSEDKLIDSLYTLLDFIKFFHAISTIDNTINV